MSQGDPGHEFAVCGRSLPDGWTCARQGDWVTCIPPEAGLPKAGLPKQGWKIHASGCLDNSEEIITRVWDYCTAREISFKFVSSKLRVLLRNGKYAPRGSSGKIVTIYPVDETACECILAGLNAELNGAPGPYILSDLRYGSGPLYVRYGAFTERRCLDEHGDLVPAIQNAAGELVPDVRGPVFSPPPWVPLPEFLRPHLAARGAVTVDDMPYRVEEVLHFSNGGGVYLAVDQGAVDQGAGDERAVDELAGDVRAGAKVVLKEARPHAGLAADGSDAVARLGRERDMLARLSGLGIAPEPLGYFRVGEHHFLAEEFIEGEPLNACYAARYPLTVAEPDPGKLAAYTEWALRICADIERAAGVMHGRGVIFNDLHMFNIIVRPDDTVAFIDFEAASELREGRRITVGAPGFAAPRERAGVAVDSYSLACIRLAMFLPLTTLLPLDRDKAAEFAAVIAEHFPVPQDFLDDAVREITRPAQGKRPDKEAERETTRRYDQVDSAALGRAIIASATPWRTDRLFPGDIEQFAGPGGGLGIAHGAAGVLYALAAAGLRIPAHEQWLLDRAADPPRGGGLGLYDGLAGVAWVLAGLGHGDAAISTAGICLDSRWQALGPDLYGGLAGFSLAMLGIGDRTAELAMTRAGMRAAELVADLSPGATSAGLMRGAAGHALLFVRLYERTGDPAWLDHAERAIAADLARCVTDHRGSLQVDEGWRMLPYLAGGSAGIGMVIDRFLACRPCAAFTEAAASIRIAARSAFYVQAGLFNGRAGMILYLAGSGDPAVAAHVRRLRWHAVPYADGLALAGDQLLRLSMDLGTGTAGVLLSLLAAQSTGGAELPFLGPPLKLPGDIRAGAGNRVSVRR